MPVQWQNIDVPFTQGLQGRFDERALEPPGLLRADDVQANEIGGLQMRPQFQPVTGSVGSSVRRLYQAGDELLAFTADKLYSRDSGGTWRERADHLAVDVQEYPRFVRTGEQFDCDRAEHSGVVMCVWAETTPSGTSHYVSAIDKETGTVLLEPEVIRASINHAKVIATTNSFMVIYTSSLVVYYRQYSPTSLGSFSENNSGTAGAATDLDVCLDTDTPTQVWAVVKHGGTAYRVLAIPEGLTVATSTVRSVTVSGPVAIAYNPDSNEVGIAFNTTTSVLADFYDTSLSAINTSIGVGTSASATVSQIGLVYESSDVFRCFWSDNETVGASSNNFAVEHNTVESDTTTGTSDVLLEQVGIAARPFRYDDETYIWVAFASTSQGDITAQLQNGYFLVRVSDGLICAKAAPFQAGGFHSQGFLPNVANTSGNVFAWAGEFRRIVPLNESESEKGYAAKSVHDIVFEFDSNKARRVAVLGETVYVSGSLVQQYDGRGLYEVGFHYFPWDIGVVAGGGGSNLNGTYSWKNTFAWENARGEIEESTTTTTFAAAIASNSAQLQGVNLTLTAKQQDGNQVELRWYRQEDSAAEGAPYFQVSSRDPAATGSNDYLENDPSVILAASVLVDDYGDDTLLTQRPNYENGGNILPNLPPPSASIVVATQDRLLLAGIPGNPHRVVYSKLRGQGEVAAFSDGLFVDLPPSGGPITALAFLNETLIAFKERAIYALTGDGFDNAGGGTNYGPGRLLASDVGAESQEAVELTPRGLIFKSQKGWHLLNQGWQAQYIGGAVSDYDSDTVRRIHIIDDKQQVRCLTDSRMLVWDYLIDQWFVWGVSSTDSVIIDGTHNVLRSTNTTLLAEATTHDGTISGSRDAPAPDIETAWIRMGHIAGFQRIRRFQIVGEIIDSCSLRIRVAYDYSDSYSEEQYWHVDPDEAGPLCAEVRLARQKCKAIKIRIGIVNEDGDGDTPDPGENQPITLACKLTGLTLQVGVKPGLNKGLPLAQRGLSATAVINGGGGGGG